MILSLDLGITTGYAVMWDVHDSVNIEEHGYIPEECLEDALRQIKKDNLPARGKSKVVMEMPVIVRGPLGVRLQAVVDTALTVFPKAEQIQAAQWKPTPHAKFQCPRGVTQHERDAIRIGVWFLNRIGQL